MTGEVIKSFLVGLGFDVDDASLAKFNKAISSAAVRVTALYAGIQASAAGIFHAISGISQGFEDMGYQLRLVSPALNKMLLLREAMLNTYRIAGIDIVKVVKQSIQFNYSLAKTKIALDAIYKSVGARFLPLLTKQMDIFRLKIFQNMPKIQDSLEKFVKFIFRAFSATVELGTRVWSIIGRVWDFFKELDRATDGWSTKILGFIAVWKLLNLSFLATPLGLLLTGLTALLALYDDFKVFQEGGKSFFNWSSAIPVINAVKVALSDLWDIAKKIFSVFTDIFGHTSSWAKFKDDIYALVKAFGALWNAVGGIAGAIDQWAAKNIPSVAEFFNGPDYKNVGKPGYTPPSAAVPIQAPPLLPPGTTNNNSHRISLQTEVNVQASGDANAIGDAVAAKQSSINRDNFDLIRNLVGNTQ